MSTPTPVPPAVVPAATTEEGELDLSITNTTTWNDGSKTTMEDIGAREGVGDGVTVTEDFKINPADPEDHSFSVGVIKRFEI